MSTNKKDVMRVMILTFLLVSFGIFMVYSASNIWALAKFNDSFYYLRRQILFALTGIVGFFICYNISSSFLKRHALKIVLFTFLLLVLVLIPGIGVERNGSRSWFGIGSFAVQPSELFKIAIVIYSASFISNNYQKTKNIKGYFPLIIMLVVGFILIMMQPDFGTAIVIVCGVIVMMFVSKLPIKYFAYMSACGVFLIVGLILMAPYRFQRITAFIDPWQDPLGSGFQIIQSLYAIGPGALLGNGLFNSYQKHFYLPEPQTDFIFAIAVEEIGLIGGLLVIVAFIALFYYGFRLARNQKSLFDSFIIVGLLGLIMIQVVINLGVVVGILPVTGITLPLISYGGSSLSVCLCSLGLICGRERKGIKEDESNDSSFR